MPFLFLKKYIAGCWSFKKLLFFLMLLLGFSVNAQENPWASCVSAIDYTHAPGSSEEIRVFDKFQRDITHAGIALMDWEGFVDNPHFEFTLHPPEGVVFPISVEIRANDAPRLYLLQRNRFEHPYDIWDYFSVHNETGPLWGVELRSWKGENILGGVSHDLSDEALREIGLIREYRVFYEHDFPLRLFTGIHPDREAGDEQYQLQIKMVDQEVKTYEQTVNVSVCDQDIPDREVEFQFHLDYSADFDGYLETTTDGMKVKEGHERILNDLAYFFEDMQFDTIEEGGCSAFVNWTVEDQPGYKANSKAYSNGYYLFMASHSGGGGLSSTTVHTSNGEATDFPACGFWGTNPRDELSTYVNTRIYLPEDDWWRTSTYFKVWGRDGECLGDSLGDPGNGCIECPDDEEWCGHIRGDFYWPNLHELNHGLTMSTAWPRWKEWFDSDTLCIDDEASIMQFGSCLPMYKTDHVVTSGLRTESNKPPDIGRTMFKRYDLLLMQAVGWELRDTTMLTALSIYSSEFEQGQVGETYEAQVEIMGGIPSYVVRVVSGYLPPGLSLNSFNGKIQGTPTQAGDFDFEIEVLDSDQYNVLRRNGVKKQFNMVIYD